jgi:hypothetical protein
MTQRIAATAPESDEFQLDPRDKEIDEVADAFYADGSGEL